MQKLFLITARGGSKGIPKKNIKLLEGKPLIYYSIDIAKQFVDDEYICVSTDDDEIIQVVEKYPLKVPFKRPAHLATDTASSFDVIIHALQHYNSVGLDPQVIVLFQPTSPFRRYEDVQNALNAFNENIDMVVSCVETDANPYFILFEENKEGYLVKSKEFKNAGRRQDMPKVYQINGAVYVINSQSLKKYYGFDQFTKTKKVMMNKINSLDIDEPIDWQYAEFLLKGGHVKI